ncbi:hypothetical protein B484DRAFT_407583, partial [Ochromonadaceae sp. CCMP2298]
MSAKNAAYLQQLKRTTTQRVTRYERMVWAVISIAVLLLAIFYVTDSVILPLVSILLIAMLTLTYASYTAGPAPSSSSGRSSSNGISSSSTSTSSSGISGRSNGMYQNAPISVGNRPQPRPLRDISHLLSPGNKNLASPGGVGANRFAVAGADLSEGGENFDMQSPQRIAQAVWEGNQGTEEQESAGMGLGVGMGMGMGSGMGMGMGMGGGSGMGAGMGAGGATPPSLYPKSNGVRSAASVGYQYSGFNHASPLTPMGGAGGRGGTPLGSMDSMGSGTMGNMGSGSMGSGGRGAHLQEHAAPAWHAYSSSPSQMDWGGRRGTPKAKPPLRSISGGRSLGGGSGGGD